MCLHLTFQHLGLLVEGDDDRGEHHTTAADAAGDRVRLRQLRGAQSGPDHGRLTGDMAAVPAFRAPR